MTNILIWIGGIVIAAGLIGLLWQDGVRIATAKGLYHLPDRTRNEKRRSGLLKRTYCRLAIIVGCGIIIFGLTLE